MISAMSMATTWLRVTVETRRPIPTVQRAKRSEAVTSSGMLPRSGTSNHHIPTAMIVASSRTAMPKYAIIFPATNSQGRSGET